MRHRLVLCALVSALLYVMAAPSGAHIATRTDGDDTPGALDLSNASFSHANGQIRSTSRTFQAWSPSDLVNNQAFFFQYETRGDNTADYYVVVSWSGTALRGQLYRFTSGSPAFVRNVNATQDGRNVIVTFRRSAMTIRRSGNIAWMAQSRSIDASSCLAPGCTDNMPEIYMYPHSL